MHINHPDGPNRKIRITRYSMLLFNQLFEFFKYVSVIHMSILPMLTNII